MPREITGFNLSLEGVRGSTKSSTAYTGPYPSVGFAFDIGWEGAIWGAKFNQYFKNLDIQVMDYEPGRKASKDDWVGHDITIYNLPPPINTSDSLVKGKRELWAYFNERIGLALVDDYVRSCIVDTMTAGREIRTDAHLQYLQSLPRQGPPRTNLIEIEYKVPNEAVSDIWVNFAAMRKNLICTHHLRDQYGDFMESDDKGVVHKVRHTTGELELAGWGKTYDKVDAALRMETYKEQVKPGQPVVVHNKGTFAKCRYVPALEGTVLEDITWDSLMTMQELMLGNSVHFLRSGIGAAP